MQNEKIQKVKWGDIFYCNLGKANGSVQFGYRPVVVVQANALNKSSPTIVVAVITSVRKNQSMTTHILLDEDCGLSEPSMIVLEQLRTIDRVEELGRYIGTISDEIKRNEIKQGLKHLVGILRKPRRERVGRISTLCINCQKELMKNPDNMIRRIDPWQREKDLCDKCQTNYGYDYLITKKYKHTENREVKKL